MYRRNDRLYATLRGQNYKLCKKAIQDAKRREGECLKLTPKQELFAQTYVKTGNASEAYRTAYDTSRYKEKSINEKACVFLKNVKIKSRVKELQKELTEKHTITKDKILNRLQEIVYEQEKLGVDKIDLTAMNKAIDTVNKMLGYYEAEKIQHCGNITKIVREIID